ncbi:cytochrome c oxidase assembly protein [Mycobacterium sp. smrl_JER01]|uniref:cytochrome c oxidase assembly protein n=1 Tax=Mycobacterium sp. smrl_JER01 TaxID=3402633 RepID=UPI003AD0A281
MGTRPTRRAGWASPALTAWTIAVAVAVGGYASTSAAARFSATGRGFPGAVTNLAEYLGSFAASLTAAFCFGLLVVVVTTAVPDDEGRIDAAAFRFHLWVERASVVWFVLAAAMVLVDTASASGVSVSRVVASGALADALAASESARGWGAATVAAGVVAVGVRFTLRWPGHLALLIPAGIGVIAPAVTGNAGEGPDHDIATSAVIVFALALAVLFGVKMAASLTPAPGSPAERRGQRLAVVAGAAAILYGAVLLFVMVRGTELLGSGYGRLGLTAGLLLAAILATDVALVRRTATPPRPVAVAGAAAMVVVLAAVSAMAVQPAPRFLVHDFTVWDVFLGYRLPGPVTAANLLTTWRLDPLFGIASLILALAYGAGVLVLRRRGDVWPPGRTLTWTLGCLFLLLATSSGLRSYGSAMFSVHMAEHMVLNMFVPVLLVLGAPITLALRALPAAHRGQPPGPREWVLRLVHARGTRFLANPIVAFSLFVGSLYLVYFTPLFDTLIRYHWGHELMSMHFLLVGYLYYWGIIGIDPGPRRLPFLARLGLLFAVMPFHAFFGIATMTMASALGGGFYGHLALPWVASLSDDQHLGGAIAWGASEVPVVIVVIALVAQWARQDRRAGIRHDRHSDSGYDDDLDAYNAMLRELTRTRE